MRYEDVKSIGGKTRFVFRAPAWYWSALLLFLLSLLFGILVWGPSTQAALNGFVLMALSAYGSVLVSRGIVRLLREVYWAKTDLLISAASTVISMLIFAIAWGVSALFPFNMEYALMISITIPLWIRHVYMSSITIAGQRKAFPLTLTYPAMLLLAIYLYFPGMHGYIPFFLGSAASSLFFASIFLLSVDSPMRHVLGVGGLEFTMWTVEHYKEHSKRGHDMLEAIFDRFGEPGRVFFNTIAFMKGGKVKSALLVHTAHPGPVGDVGGGELPSKLRRITGIENLVTPHGASTHDLNPTTEKEVEKLGSAIRESMPGKKAQVSEPVRVSAGKTRVLAQRFGDVLMVVETSHPHGTEDIDPGVAVALREKVRQMGYSSLIFVDAHNCFMDNAVETKVQSPKYTEIEQAVMKAAEVLKDAGTGPAHIGYGQDRSLGIEYGIAPLGVQAVVVEAGGKKAGYVVIDGNNMVKGLRDEIIKGISGLDEIEVMTTDNHYVNRTSGGKNPVGYYGGHDDIVKACGNAVKKALEDLEDVDVMVSEGETTIRVFGPNRAAYMYSVPRAIDGMGRYSAFLSLLSVVLVDVLLAMLI